MRSLQTAPPRARARLRRKVQSTTTGAGRVSSVGHSRVARLYMPAPLAATLSRMTQCRTVGAQPTQRMPAPTPCPCAASSVSGDMWCGGGPPGRLKPSQMVNPSRAESSAPVTTCSEPSSLRPPTAPLSTVSFVLQSRCSGAVSSPTEAADQVDPAPQAEGGIPIGAGRGLVEAARHPHLGARSSLGDHRLGRIEPFVDAGERGRPGAAVPRTLLVRGVDADDAVRTLPHRGSHPHPSRIGWANPGSRLIASSGQSRHWPHSMHSSR